MRWRSPRVQGRPSAARCAASPWTRDLRQRGDCIQASDGWGRRSPDEPSGTARKPSEIPPLSHTSARTPGSPDSPDPRRVRAECPSMHRNHPPERQEVPVAARQGHRSIVVSRTDTNSIPRSRPGNFSATSPRHGFAGCSPQRTLEPRWAAPTRHQLASPTRHNPCAEVLVS